MSGERVGGQTGAQKNWPPTTKVKVIVIVIRFSWHYRRFLAKALPEAVFKSNSSDSF